MGSPRLLLIASREVCPALPSAVAAALSALPRGGAIVQLREKSLEAGPLLALARTLLPVCRAAGASLLVNDRCDVALTAGLEGVHLPAAGLSARDARVLLPPDSLIGVSCHTVDEVAQASSDGADYCVFGPVFEVPGKGPAQGLGALQRAARAASIPVFALGGIDAGNALAALEAGARGVACQRAILGAPDPAAAARAVWGAISLAGGW